MALSVVLLVVLHMYGVLVMVMDVSKDTNRAWEDF